ncbi:MAG: radical SAM protein [Candidatus Ozemobacteraceae bacterium]
MRSFPGARSFPATDNQLLRLAIVFPPQWDPRQPPRAPWVLEAAGKAAGAETRIFDFNVALYRRLLTKSPAAGAIEPILQRWLSPDIFSDAKSFARHADLLERAFNEAYADSVDHQLFWDGLRSPLSPNATADWRRVLETPSLIPALRHIELDIADLLAWRPDAVAVSVISDTQLLISLGLVSRLRRRLPGAKILLGGDAFAYRRSILGSFPWLFKLVDGIAIADGEAVIEKLVQGVPCAEIPGVFSMVDGVIRSCFGSDHSFDGYPPASNEPHEISILHQNPPNPSDACEKFIFGDATTCCPTSSREEKECSDPREMIFGGERVAKTFSLTVEKWGKQLQDYLCAEIVVPIETARGCPWGKCSFCIHPPRDIQGKAGYCTRSLTGVEDEVRVWLKNGVTRFFFVDEALPAPRLQKLSEMACRLPRPISWLAYARLDGNHTFERLRAAREAGCRKLFFGLETGSPRLLERFQKGILPATAVQVLRNAGKAGIAVHLFLMTGFPGETDDDRTATLRLLDEVLPSLDSFGFTYDLFGLHIERETALFQEPSRFGARQPSIDCSNDAAFQFDPGLSTEERAAVAEFSDRIASTVERHHGESFGLRHMRLSQDSLHLLLIENSGVVSAPSRST